MLSDTHITSNMTDHNFDPEKIHNFRVVAIFQQHLPVSIESSMKSRQILESGVMTGHSWL